MRRAVVPMGPILRRRPVDRWLCWMVAMVLHLR
jgi:hypothetical protein